MCGCHGLNHVPPKRYVQASANVTLFCRCSLVTVQSLGWTLIQYDWYPYQKRRGTEGESHVRMEAEIDRSDV